ncbi:unnamed protein product [Kuraishia capsulata CBS 1993]|uniref:Inner kinetochore subunit AME1 domain-containing protein n=1 Tax=Kuraishia capsulata CBS 1993 TaxID=1382522 RepID=W6MJX8_9ASCO|nr:uncharacterized protein KUCA_T00002569001 [Kuraishia capsulata CBS 1993]CDK26596.1 unnamed protein product [Kuraishia capsulata CBS 1993]
MDSRSTQRESQREVRRRGAASRHVSAPDIRITVPSGGTINRQRRLSKSTGKSPVAGLRSVLNRDPKSPKRIPVPVQSFSPSWESPLMTRKRVSKTRVEKPSSKSPGRAKRSNKLEKSKKPGLGLKAGAISSRTQQPQRRGKTKSQLLKPARTPNARAPRTPRTPKAVKQKPVRTFEQMENIDRDPESEPEVDSEYHSAVESPALDIDTNSMQIKYERLTRTSKITTVDVLIEIIKDYISRFQQTTSHSVVQNRMISRFEEDVVAHLMKLTDLRLTNESLNSQIGQLNRQKNELRTQIYEVRGKQSDIAMELNKERQSYHSKRQQSLIRARIGKVLYEKDFKMEEIGTVRTKLNDLDTVVNPSWGLVEKLKITNDKLDMLKQMIES